MASVDKSLDAANIDDNAETDATSSCLNDPNYAIICVFLQKFGGQLKIEHPDFLRLQKMIENTDEVHDELKQFFVKLLRKTRKSVQPDKLDSALAKFCYTYSAQDAWEVERFGYKKSSLTVKLRILKEVLESQFDKNPNFRTLISTQTAAELRSQPLGKDKLGNAYWSIVDEQCNLRIYQEHLDEEIWKVVATNRDEMAKLIACLRGNELVMPSLVGIIDEDSSSNSMPPKVDALQNENGTSNTNESDDKNVPCLKIKLNSNGGESTVEQISNSDNTNGAKNPSQNDSVEDEDGEEEEEDASIMSEIDEQSQAASESSATTVGTKSNETPGSKRITLLASKPPSNANKLKLRIFATDTKTIKRSLEDDSDTASSRNKRSSAQSRMNGADDDSEFESEEMSDEELEESSNEEIGQAIEEATMYVQGEGSGADNNCENTIWPDCYNDDCDVYGVGEAIEEEILYVFGEGSGRDCDVGNNDIKSTETPTSSATIAPPQPVVQSKPMFFFGQAGCLKLSPMKQVVSTENSSAANENKNDIENEKSQESSLLSIVNESSTNDTNPIALDAKSECFASENTENNTDETDKGISINNETVVTLVNEPQNNVSDKIDNTSTSKNDSTTSDSTAQIEANTATKADEQFKVTASNELSSAATIDNESSKENIKSNSSVALANISVQETESIEEKYLPTISTVLQIESHLLSNDRENDSCLEKQSSEPQVAIENLPENKPNESSEILNETNNLANKSELGNENQSSVSQFENEPSGEQAIELSTFKNDAIAKSNKSSEQVEETNDLTEQIESDIMPLVKEKVPQETKHECSNVVDNESNNQVKTDSPNEQKAIESEPTGNLSPVQETSEQSFSNVIEETECRELEIELPKQIKNTIQELHETPSEQTTELIEAEDLPKPPEVTSVPIESHSGQPSLVNERIEQQIEQPIESLSTRIKSVVNEYPETPLNKIVPEEPELEPQPDLNDNESIPSDATESTSIVCEPKTIEQNKSGREVVSIEVSDLVDESQFEQSTPEDALEDQNVAEPQTRTTAELIPVQVIEKRKSIDQIEEASECKKICEEKVNEELEQLATLEKEKPIEIPSMSQLEPCVSKSSAEYAEYSGKNEVIQTDFEVPNQVAVTKSLDEPTLIASNKEEFSTNSVETKVDIWHETSKIDQVVLPDKVLVAAVISEKEPVSSEANLETTEVTETQETLSTPVVKYLKEYALPSPATQSTQYVQLQNRKRRITAEKARHSSESDDNNDALIESPLSQDASSDEEVGGKRIKMRPKVVKRTLRKSVEQKRNIKDTDWSSDENEKPNAKRATNDISKQTENILPSPEQTAPEIKEKKPSSIKEEGVTTAEKKGEAPSEETKTKAEENEETAEHQSDEEQATPTRRPGRPARRGRKPGPKPKQKPVEEVNIDEIKEESIEETTEQNESVKEEKTEAPSIKPETRRKKRSLLGLDIAEIENAQASIDETPVRQSRRIAQIKIREEAERRKAEEVALQKMKEASEKKKKGVAVKQSESEEENSESEAKLEKKKRRKKGNKDKPWQTDSDDSSEREEEDVYEHEDVERLPPLGSDHEFSPESDIEDESQIVPTKRARTARKDKTERREEESEEEEDIHACQKCGKSDHPEWILLCDKCDKGYHCSCLIPVLFVIPEGDWFCPPCQQDKLIDQLEAKLIEYDNMVKQKEIEEAQRQRLLLTTISEANVIKDTKRDRQRSRAQDIGSDETDESSSTDEESDAEEKANNSERRTRPRTDRQRNRIESSEHSSSSDNTSDNEPIYKLRKRRQANVSYRFNEYDELINRAIKSEMDEVAGAGNLGRGKDISTIIDAVKEEKRLKKLEEQQKERELAGETKKKDDKNDGGDDNDSDDQPLKSKVDKSDGSDSEPIRPRAIKRSKNISKKKKKLNSLDVDSDEDADSSDDDFNTSSYSDDEEEDDSSAPSESSLDSIVKKKGKGRGISTRRSVRERKKRYDADFIDDSSFDDEDNVPLVKKKKKVESDFDDFDDSSEELEADVDSEDLCDDSTDESDRSWGKKKKKASSFKISGNNKNRKKNPDGERSFKGKTAKKKSKISDDDDDDDDEEESEDYGDEVLPKSRRTRGKKLPYLLDDDFDSSDDGIKPGVKRPDTPPEERAAFIKKQEEIKRMLAEKENDDKSLQIPPPQNDSLSTIPPQIIQSAKALDVDLKKSAILHRNASDNDSNGFDDDLPEDFDPEDMDEDAIAKMMEEEEFAQQQLKLAGETIRNRKLKDSFTDPMKKDDLPTKLTIETGSSVIMPVNLPPSLVSPLPLTTSQLTIPDIPPSMYTAQLQGANNKQTTTPKKRGRKTKDDISPIIAKESPPQIPTIQHTSILTPNKPNTLLNMPSVLQHALTPQLFTSSTIQHTSSVIAHSSVIQQQSSRLPPMPQTTAPGILGLAQGRDHIIPTTLNVQNTRLLDPSELGKPPEDLLDPSTKKRARSRKKITPTRDSLTSLPNVTVPPGGIAQPTPAIIPNVPNVSKPPSSILSERLSANPVDKAGLSIATPPSLYSPSSRSQASVITRLTRPSQRQPFPSGQSPPQRYYAPNTSMPPHSIPSTATGSHSRPYHTPNVTVSSGQRPPPLVPPPHTSSHLPPHPMYMRGQPGIYGGYPNIQPPPMHRSLQSLEHATNSPQNFPGAYQNLPFGSYYAAAAAADRRSGAIIGTFEPFDNKNPSAHDRLPAYAHPGLGLATLAGRNSAGDGDDERGQPGAGGSTSEFSGLVSYFSSQQDDLDS